MKVQRYNDLKVNSFEELRLHDSFKINLLGDLSCILIKFFATELRRNKDNLVT